MGLFTPLVSQPRMAARPRQTSAPWPQGLPSSAKPASTGCTPGFSTYHSFRESSARVSPQLCRVCWLAAGRRPSLSRERETRSQCARPMPSRSSTSARRRGCTASWDCRTQCARLERARQSVSRQTFGGQAETSRRRSSKDSWTPDRNTRGHPASVSHRGAGSSHGADAPPGRQKIGARSGAGFYSSASGRERWRLSMASSGRFAGAVVCVTEHAVAALEVGGGPGG